MIPGAYKNKLFVTTPRLPAQCVCLISVRITVRSL